MGSQDGHHAVRHGRLLRPDGELGAGGAPPGHHQLCLSGDGPKAGRRPITLRRAARAPPAAGGVGSRQDLEAERHPRAPALWASRVGGGVQRSVRRSRRDPAEVSGALAARWRHHRRTDLGAAARDRQDLGGGDLHGLLLRTLHPVDDRDHVQKRQHDHPQAAHPAELAGVRPVGNQSRDQRPGGAGDAPPLPPAASATSSRFPLTSPSALCSGSRARR